jgi:hypothetical protein
VGITECPSTCSGAACERRRVVSLGIRLPLEVGGGGGGRRVLVLGGEGGAAQQPGWRRVCSCPAAPAWLAWPRSVAGGRPQGGRWSQGSSSKPLPPCERPLPRPAPCPRQVFKTAGRGFGVRCAQPIAVGQYVCSYLGLVISEADAEARAGDDTYLYDLNHFHLLRAGGAGRQGRAGRRAPRQAAAAAVAAAPSEASLLPGPLPACPSPAPPAPNLLASPSPPTPPSPPSPPRDRGGPPGGAAVPHRAHAAAAAAAARRAPGHRRQAGGGRAWRVVVRRRRRCLPQGPAGARHALAAELLVAGGSWGAALC